MDHQQETVNILRDTIKEYRVLLQAAAKIILKSQDQEESQNWLALAQKYGVVNVCDENNR